MKQLLTLPLLCFAMLMVGCQKDEINTEDELLTGSELVSAERCVPSCDDCPVMTHCCCEVRIVEIQQNGDLRFCGDFFGCGPLSPPCAFEGTINCPPIDGIIFLDSFNPNDTLLLCILQDEAFIIRNETMLPVSLEIGCKQSSGPPTVISIVLGLGEIAVIDLDGGCIPDQCN